MVKLKISLKARALRYLSAREHSRIELTRKLSLHAQEGDDLEALLGWLEISKFLSQTRFSESLVHRRSAKFGNSRILSELQSHGIEGEELNHIKTGLNQNEIARACEVWRKKFTRKPENANECAKQMRFLMQRGFSHRAIQIAMRGIGTDEFDTD